MVEPYHGYLYFKKGEKPINPFNHQQNKSMKKLDTGLLQNPQVPPPSGLPIMTPNIEIGQQASPFIRKATPQDYGDLLLEKKPIIYIPPEIIPREVLTKEVHEKSKKPNYFIQDNKKILGDEPGKKMFDEGQGKRFGSFNQIREKQKGEIFDQALKEHSLHKYKINLNQPIVSSKKKKEIYEPIKPKPISIVEKKYILKKPEIIPFEKQSIKKKSIKKVSRKPSIKKVSRKPSIKKVSRKPSIKKVSRKPSVKKLSIKKKFSSKKFKDPKTEIQEIEKSDELYKLKFDKLKKAYIKKHKTLLQIFNGYQNMYDKVLKET
jgi:hypothetical protein